MDYFVSSGATISQVTTPPITTIVSPEQFSIIDRIYNISDNIIPSEITSSIDLPLVSIVFVRVLLIIWVLKDSNYRSSSTFFCLLSLLLVTVGTPILGLPIYLAIRPLGYKHERNYWRAMNESMEEAEIMMDNDTEWDSVEDEQHLAELRAQATLAQKRAKKVISPKKTNTSHRKVPVKRTSSKTTTSKIPAAKKAATRTAQK